MNLSELAYRSIKEAIYLDDSGFTLEAYKDGTYYESPEYGIQINNVYSPINEALNRLSDLEKLPYNVVEIDKQHIEKGDDAYIVDYSYIKRTVTGCSQDIPVKEVINVALKIGSRFIKIEAKPFGLNKLILGDDYNENYKLYIEYKEDLPYFTEKEAGVYPYNEEETGDIDLRDFGITNAMCSYIMEYAMAKLSEDVDPSLSNLHLTRAEQYFANIRCVTSALNQTLVYKKYSIGE